MGGYGCFGSCSIDLRIQLISAHGDDSMYFEKGANASFVIWPVICLLICLSVDARRNGVCRADHRIRQRGRQGLAHQNRFNIVQKKKKSSSAKKKVSPRQRSPCVTLRLRYRDRGEESRRAAGQLGESVRHRLRSRRPKKHARRVRPTIIEEHQSGTFFRSQLSFPDRKPAWDVVSKKKQQQDLSSSSADDGQTGYSLARFSGNSTSSPVFQARLMP